MSPPAQRRAAQCEAEVQGLPAPWRRANASVLLAPPSSRSAVTPRHIAALDVSTANIGFATTVGDVVSLRAQAGSEDPVRRLHQLWVALGREMRRHPPLPDLLLIEGYALSKPPHQGVLSKIRLGEVGAVARLMAFEYDIPIREVPPNCVKKFATGNGRADKPEMIAAAIAMGVRGSVNHDEADAWHLRRMGRVAYGLEPARALHEQVAVAALEW